MVYVNTDVTPPPTFKNKMKGALWSSAVSSRSVPMVVKTPAVVSVLAVLIVSICATDWIGFTLFAGVLFIAIGFAAKLLIEEYWVGHEDAEYSMLWFTYPAFVFNAWTKRSFPPRLAAHPHLSKKAFRRIVKLTEKHIERKSYSGLKSDWEITASYLAKNPRFSSEYAEKWVLAGLIEPLQTSLHCYDFDSEALDRITTCLAEYVYRDALCAGYAHEKVEPPVLFNIDFIPDVTLAVESFVRHPKLSMDNLLRLHYSIVMFKKAFNSFSLPESLFISSSVQLASRPGTPEALLTELALSRNVAVRERVLNNPNCPKRVRVLAAL